MITENYVSFEIAKLLKEKGFDARCPMIYTVDGEMLYTDIKHHNMYAVTNKQLEYYTDIIAPTQSMAMKWLREVHNIDIDIEAAVGMLGVKVYVPHISTYKPLEDDSSKVCQIKRGIHYKDDHWVIPALQYFDSYEEAVEAALKYSLENLI